MGVWAVASGGSGWPRVSSFEHTKDASRAICDATGSALGGAVEAKHAPMCESTNVSMVVGPGARAGFWCGSPRTVRAGPSANVIGLASPPQLRSCTAYVPAQGLALRGRRPRFAPGLLGRLRVSLRGAVIPRRRAKGAAVELCAKTALAAMPHVGLEASICARYGGRQVELTRLWGVGRGLYCTACAG